jgi:hypothetical protein
MSQIMQPSPLQTPAESFAGVWSALHRSGDFTVSDAEVHYLTATALAVDDELTSHLLLKKLKLASTVTPTALPPTTVVMNSFLEFVLDGGQKRFHQLVHPSAHAPSYALSITSLLGVGVLGARAGQTVLWLDDGGRFCDLHILHVENCPGLSKWVGGAVGRVE